ncbi:glycoside hydrolase family 13 protein [Aulographum hederae CBS 113979]|uniref:alpha-amylase n=1 Tax=Aulographum hederae CBS 113979 TaxID=1176131 RepID=A0A6G1GVB6_9PEZI|nr:glycoside hydrolase family 13 protein [Aulographum hederae CBS 113979]
MPGAGNIGVGDYYGAAVLAWAGWWPLKPRGSVPLKEAFGPTRPSADPVQPSPPHSPPSTAIANGFHPSSQCPSLFLGPRCLPNTPPFEQETRQALRTLVTLVTLAGEKGKITDHPPPYSSQSPPQQVPASPAARPAAYSSSSTQAASPPHVQPSSQAGKPGETPPHLRLAFVLFSLVVASLVVQNLLHLQTPVPLSLFCLALPNTIMNPSTFPSNPLASTLLALLVLFSIITPSLTATPDQWRERSIYQIITDRFARDDGSTSSPCVPGNLKYCGGTWKGIMDHLDYVQGMGFTAIWISPLAKGIEQYVSGAGENYHGFWQTDPAELNEHFGTAAELKALSKELHRRDMYLMVDFVANNLAAAGPGKTVDLSQFPPPFNQPSWFHPYCAIVDYSDPENYQNCWFGNGNLSQPDLNTQNSAVRDWFANLGVNLRNEYNIDGFRIDAAKHVDKPFWQELQDQTNIFSIGEVFSNDSAEVCNYQIDALDSVLNFPLFYKNATLPISSLVYGLTDVATACMDTTLLGNFVENQDVARFASMTDDISQLKNAIVFAMLGDGIPVIYYGSEQQFSGAQDPFNREALWLSKYDTDTPIYKMIKGINFARNAMVAHATSDYWRPYWRHKSKIAYSDDDILAVRKGYDSSIVSITTNKGSGAPDIGPIQIGDTNFDDNIEIVDILSCSTRYTGLYGAFMTTVTKGEPQAWIPTSYVNGTLNTICPSTTALEKAPPPSSASSRISSPSSQWLLAATAAIIISSTNRTRVTGLSLQVFFEVVWRHWQWRGVGGHVDRREATWGVFQSAIWIIPSESALCCSPDSYDGGADHEGCGSCSFYSSSASRPNFHPVQSSPAKEKRAKTRQKDEDDVKTPPRHSATTIGY